MGETDKLFLRRENQKDESAFRVVPEHLSSRHSLLVATGEYIPGNFSPTADSNIALALLINDVLGVPGFDGTILFHQFKPTFGGESRSDGKAYATPDAIKAHLQRALLEAALLGDSSNYVLAKESGKVEIVSFPAILGRNYGHIRDHFLLVQDAQGSRTMLVPRDTGKEGEVSRLRPLAARLGVRLSATRVDFEGGNMLGDGSRNYTLGETIFDNMSGQGASAVEGLEDLLGGRTGKLIILDQENWETQPIYHLDLAVSFISDGHGGTVGLLSSLSLARTLLVEAGIDVDSSFPAWRKTVVDDRYRSDVIGESIERRMREAMMPGSRYLEIMSSLPPGEARKRLREVLRNNMSIPTETLWSLGQGIRFFFEQGNYRAVQGYLDFIGNELARHGIPVVQVPALLLASGQQVPTSRFGFEAEVTESRGLSRMPHFCQANGVTFHGEKDKLYLSSGGIIPFDTYMRDILGRYGYTFAPLFNAASMGWSQAGVHCNFVPYYPS